MKMLNPYTYGRFSPADRFRPVSLYSKTRNRRRVYKALRRAQKRSYITATYSDFTRHGLRLHAPDE